MSRFHCFKGAGQWRIVCFLHNITAPYAARRTSRSLLEVLTRDTIFTTGSFTIAHTPYLTIHFQPVQNQQHFSEWDDYGNSNQGLYAIAWMGRLFPSRRGMIELAEISRQGWDPSPWCLEVYGRETLQPQREKPYSRNGASHVATKKALTTIEKLSAAFFCVLRLFRRMTTEVTTYLELKCGSVKSLKKLLCHITTLVCCSLVQLYRKNSRLWLKNLRRKPVTTINY